MKSKLLLLSFFAGLGTISHAQSKLAYAITGDGNRDFNWMNIRQVDLSTGQIVKTNFDRQKDKASIEFKSLNGSVQLDQKLVAAAAYDKKSGRLYLAPMRTAELWWTNVSGKNANEFNAVQHNFISAPTNYYDEAGNITRMAIGSDGLGYMISNDGNHLISFTTTKTPEMKDLGALIDDAKNGGISIHNKCSSWGGDMVADAYGKLYIISATNHIFIVDPETKIATLAGTITGLPANFTTNGAAVDEEGNLVIASANAFAGYFKVNTKDWSATAIDGSDAVYNPSDLASGNLLFQKEADAAKGQVTIAEDNFVKSETKVYPNPVTQNSFRIELDAAAKGNYSVVLSDLSGRAILTQKLNLVSGKQFSTINLKNKPAAGTYLVKVYNSNQEVVLTDKVIIQ